MSAPVPRFDNPVNHQFTYSYAQPAEYRFCQDSVIFPKFVAGEVAALVDESTRVLDVCAGCGVIGLELAHYLPAISQLDFMEVQPVFRQSFAENLSITGRTEAAGFRFIEANYAVLREKAYSGRYDLIVANPPYFDAGNGKLPPNEVKRRCRFFIDSDLSTLARGVCNALKPTGLAYLLIKSGEIHGENTLAALQEAIIPGANAQIVADIRGTNVVRISCR